LRLARFGYHGELHNAFLQRHHALGAAADDPQGDIFVRFEPDFFEPHFECEFCGRPGYVSAANLSSQIFRSFDARVRNEIIGQYVNIPDNGDDVAPGEARAGQPRAAALSDGNLTSEDGLNAANAARYKNNRRIETML